VNKQNTISQQFSQGENKLT